MNDSAKTGVTFPKGFRASGVHCGIRKNSTKKDLALILADVDCSAAAVCTTNRVQAAPIQVTKKNLSNGKARAILVNSGNANACAEDGEANALRCCAALACAAGIGTDEIIVNSTGVIGQRLPVETIERSIPKLVAELDANGSDAAAKAIMTTDTTQKETSAETMIGGALVKVGAIAKGSGMIHPNMATLLCFVTTDCAISSGMLHKALTESVDESFNRVSVDGDTSTNDMTAILASGLAGNECITRGGSDYDAFAAALKEVCLNLAKMIAKDGEGARKLITCRVSGAKSESEAVKLSMSVNTSSLVKTMVAGSDANCGRILCALGYAGIEFDPKSVKVALQSAAGRVLVCDEGLGLSFDETLAKNILEQDDILIDCEIDGGGGHSAETYGCDLTSEYVRINGDYRS
ncbi:MAG: bifunctional glutamate N-acetyltransferase/amino-acid acetyltransferase ArgJ [Defluviitaleaceae bacterium]|nr:bifunctional glutamate N-acetyltransferase/amino-acid acetyltransferase ArgJ [Defluviitaleaceae bacterium]